MTVCDLEEVSGYESLAREFPAKGRDCLAAGDRHQASEKGWGAASPMAKAVAAAQVREYDNHADFGSVPYRARVLTGNLRISELRGDVN